MDACLTAVADGETPSQWPFSCDLDIDYGSEENASIVYAAIAVDAELQPDKVKRQMSVSDGKLLVCLHCAAPLSIGTETSSWTVDPFIRDSFSMIGSAVGAAASAFYGMNHVLPVVQRWVKGPMWLHFLIGVPPVMVLSSACAGLTGGAAPALAQLVSSSCHATISSSSSTPSALTPEPALKDDEMKIENLVNDVIPASILHHPNPIAYTETKLLCK